MSSDGKARILKYGISALVGLLLTVTIAASRDFLGAETALERVLILADAFSVPGLLLILSAGLVFASNEGALDGISYALRYAVSLLIPGGAATRQERYGDYVESKRQKPRKSVASLLIVGGVYLAVGLVFTAAFHLMGG